MRSTPSATRNSNVEQPRTELQVEASANPSKRGKRARAALVFACLAAVWLAFDMATKNYFNGSFAPGDVITDPIAGLFRFRLVHNTGAAWGMFGDSTFALGIMSVLVCTALLVYLIAASKDMNEGQIIGLALVFAGGVGNALDRFTLGYVVDFIDFTFIDFPVFNIADIGVTCGFVVFIASMLYAWRKADRKAALEAQKADCGDAESCAEKAAEGKARDAAPEDDESAEAAHGAGEGKETIA